jgi:ferric-dicitrate binding protein FerR (iron transport regulator)
VLVVVASITIAEPINSKFRRLPEGQAPQRAEHHRSLWRRFHAVRNLAALAALACLAAAAVV